MTSFYEEEVLRSGTAGVFRLHSLILNIESLNELPPESCDVEDVLELPPVVALHAHEYIHYLHNLTTRAGLGCLTDILLLVQPLQSQKVAGATEVDVPCRPGLQLRTIFDSLRKTKGYVEHIPDNFRWRRVESWEFFQIKPKPQQLPAILVDPGQSVEFDVTAVFDNGDELKFTLSPGLDFITEGIAYEIDRHIRIKAGASPHFVDEKTPAFPYLAYGPLLEFLAGGKVLADERVFLGTLALLAPSPSVALTSLSEHQSYEENTLGAARFTAIASDIVEGFSNYSEWFKDNRIPMFYEIFAGSNILTKGMQVYEKLIVKGLNSRSQRPYFELAFLKDAMTVKNFKKISAHLLERVVFQSKPGSELEIRWEGAEGSVVTMSADMHEAFAVLQSCIHYVQQHLTNTRLEAKADPRPTRCPFSGACTVESRAGNPNICRSEPWKARNIGDDGSICTYQAGVDAFMSLRAPQPAMHEDSLPF